MSGLGTSYVISGTDPDTLAVIRVHYTGTDSLGKPREEPQGIGSVELNLGGRYTGVGHSTQSTNPEWLRAIARAYTLAAEALEARVTMHEVIPLEALAGHFHGCPTATGRPAECDYCQERSASMAQE